MIGDLYFCLLNLNKKPSQHFPLSEDEDHKHFEIVVYAMVARAFCTKDDAMLQRAVQIVEQSQVMAPIRQKFKQMIARDDRIQVISELRQVLCDLVINLQEIALLESKNSNSVSSTSSDELGTLVELITAEFDPVTC